MQWQNHGHRFTGGAHKWQGVTAVLCGYGGAASLLTQWVQTQVWVIDFCCTIALFLQVQPSFPLIAPLLLLSLTLNVFVPAVELPPSGPPRQLWCHLLKPEVSRRQTPERSLLARRAQIDAFCCVKKKLFVKVLFKYQIWLLTWWIFFVVFTVYFPLFLCFNEHSERNHKMGIEKLKWKHFCPVGIKGFLYQAAASSLGYNWPAAA